MPKIEDIRIEISQYDDSDYEENIVVNQLNNNSFNNENDHNALNQSNQSKGEVNDQSRA